MIDLYTQTYMFWRYNSLSGNPLLKLTDIHPKVQSLISRYGTDEEMWTLVKKKNLSYQVLINIAYHTSDYRLRN